MFCQNCGAQLSDDAAFCNNCGQPLKTKKSENKGQKNNNSILKYLLPLIIIVIILFVFNMVFKNSDNGILNVFKISNYVNTKSLRSAWDGDRYYDENGKLLKNGWALYNGEWYYLDNNGVYARNKLINIKGVEYYFDNDGKFLRNVIFNIPGTDYMSYFNHDGSRNKSNKFVKIGNQYVFIDSEGRIVSNKWVEVEGNWFFINELGHIVTNKWIEDTYYVDANGVMVKNGFTPQGIEVDENGKIKEAYREYLLSILYPNRYLRNYDYSGSEQDVKAISDKIQNSVIAKETLDFTSVESFDIIKFGRYEQDNVTSNGKEAIEWIVLEKDAVNHRALLWSKYILDKPSSVSSSSIKSWLSSFYNTAFTQAEKNIILYSNFEVVGNAYVSIIGHNEVINYYFYDEVEGTYYNTGTKPTQYAYSRGVTTIGSSYTSNGGYFFKNLDGNFLYPKGYTRPDKSHVGMRPLIWVEYTGTVSSKIDGNVNETISNNVANLKLAKAEQINEKYDYDDDNEVAIRIAKPKASGTASYLEGLNDNIGYAMDELILLCQEYIDEADITPRTINITTSTLSSVTSTEVIIKFSGTVTFKGTNDTKTVEYTFVYDIDNNSYDIS